MTRLTADALGAMAVEAGRLAMSHFGRVRPEAKPDGTLVTRADLEVQDLLVKRLRELEPDPSALGILGEERGLSDGLDARTLAIIDPIDGTTSFTTGLWFWGISIGIMERGRPVAGVFHVPAMGLTYLVGRDGPVFLGHEPLPRLVPHPWSRFSQVAVTSDLLSSRPVAMPGKIRSLGSIAHHLCLVASGRVQAAVVTRSHLWDLAAAAAMVSRAGGVILDPDGNEPGWGALLDGRDPGLLVAGHRDTVLSLLQALQAHPHPQAPPGTHLLG